MKKTQYLTYALILLIPLVLSGCATVAYKPPIIPPKISGIYHEAQRGETIWGISKAYDIGMEEIIALNRLPDASMINEGQMIFIPYAKQKIKGTGAYAKGEGFSWPARGSVILFFNSLKDGVKNKGIDIAIREGTNVQASRSGRVSFCEEKVKGLGKTVIIDHGDGYSTVYAQNSEVLVKAGDFVKQGTVIARAGKTGRAREASLHFKILKNHIAENPFYYLP